MELSRTERTNLLVHQKLHLEIMLFGMRTVNFRCVYGHRAIDINRKRRDPSLILQLPDKVDQLLGSPPGKRRYDQAPPSPRHIMDPSCQPPLRLMSIARWP